MLLGFTFFVAHPSTSEAVPTTGSALAGGDASEWDTKWNKFKSIGKTDAEINQKVNQAYANWIGRAWNGVNPASGSTPYIFDYPGHSEWASTRWIGDYNGQGVYGRVLVEGQGAALMVAVQMNDQAGFDKLWRFTRDRMQMRFRDPVASNFPDIRTGRGLFGWYLPLRNDGTTYENQDGSGSAPDGELNIAAALYLAAGRWGNKADPYDYSVQADDITTCLINITQLNNTPDWKNPANAFTPDGTSASSNIVLLYGGGTFTDPSYNLVQYFDLFARVGKQSDRARWAKITQKSRTYVLPRACGYDVNGRNANTSINNNNTTHLPPDYCEFDGTGHNNSGEENNIWKADAWRVSHNLGVDYSWWGDANSSDFSYHQGIATAIQGHLSSVGGGFRTGSQSFPYEDARYLNGQPRYTSDSSSNNHGLGAPSCNAVLSACSYHVSALDFVREIWSANEDYNTYGTYNRFLYVESIIQCAGRWRVWGANGSTPTPTPTPTPTGTNLVTNGDASNGLSSWQNWGNAFTTSDSGSVFACGTGRGGFAQDISYTSGGAVSFSVRSRVSTPSDPGQVGIRFYNSSGTQVGDATYWAVTSTSYTTFSSTGISVPSGTTRIQIWGYKDGSTGTLYADDYVVVSSPLAPTPTPTPTVTPTPTPTSSPTTGTSLVTNGDASNGLNSWQNWGNGYTTSDSGNAVFACGTGSGGFAQDIPYTSGGEVSFSARARVSTSSDPGQVGIRFYNSGGTQIGNPTYWAVTSTSYNTFSSTGISVPSGTTRIQIWGYKDGSTGILFADDFIVVNGSTLTPTPTPTPTTAATNLVTNGAAANGLTNWQNWGNGYTTTDGGNTVFACGTGSGGFAQDIAYTSGGSVNFSLRARVTLASDPGQVGIRFYNSSGTQLANITYWSVVSTSYTAFSANNISVPSGTVRIQIWGYKDGSTGTLYADDYVVTRN